MDVYHKTHLKLRSLNIKNELTYTTDSARKSLYYWVRSPVRGSAFDVCTVVFFRGSPGDYIFVKTRHSNFIVLFVGHFEGQEGLYVVF